MAYATTNPPICVGGSNSGGGNRLWMYVSTDVHTDVDEADYFTNGDALGLKVNDIMLVADTTTPFGVTPHLVTVVTAGGAASIGAALLA